MPLQFVPLYLMLDTARPGATCPEQNDVVVLLWKCRLQNSVIPNILAL